MPLPPLHDPTKEGGEFHLWVGYCIAAWARVDDQLFRIFRACVGPLEQSAIIFYRTPGLDVRFGLTDELVLSVLPRKQRRSGGHDHADVKVWKKAIDGYGRLLGVRRRIAHHPIDLKSDYSGMGAILGMGGQGYMMPGGGMTRAVETWFEVYVNQHERLRANMADVAPLLIVDLHQHVADVWALTNRLSEFFDTALARHVKVSP